MLFLHMLDSINGELESFAANVALVAVPSTMHTSLMLTGIPEQTLNGVSTEASHSYSINQSNSHTYMQARTHAVLNLSLIDNHHFVLSILPQTLQGWRCSSQSALARLLFPRLPAPPPRWAFSKSNPVVEVGASKSGKPTKSSPLLLPLPVGGKRV